MATFKEQLEMKVKDTFQSQWQHVDARVVPETKSIGLGNSGKKLTGTVLYADLDGSTGLVQRYKREFAAEIYKTFLYCAGRIITKNDGAIRSFDGDRVMGVFQDGAPNNNAVKAALQINWAVINIIQPKLNAQYPNSKFKLKHTVGIDTSELLAVRAGVRDSNDLAWIGSAANVAAKLNGLSSEYPTWITHRVFERLNDNRKYGGNPRRAMWEQRKWTALNDMKIYRSGWYWSID